MLIKDTDFIDLPVFIKGKCLRPGRFSPHDRYGQDLSVRCCFR